MANHIPQNILDDILSRIDIVELIPPLFRLNTQGGTLRPFVPFTMKRVLLLWFRRNVRSFTVLVAAYPATALNF
jgi:hypothetical protein